jgi:hypothetical protein
MQKLLDTAYLTPEMWKIWNQKLIAMELSIGLQRARIKIEEAPKY